MFCTNCGSRLSDGDVTCLKCGLPVGASVPPPVPAKGIPNYLVPAILVTIFCCQIFGIVAIIYAASVNSKIAAGDIPGAHEASRNAKLWVLLAVGIGVVAYIASFFVALFSGIMAEGAY